MSLVRSVYYGWKKLFRNVKKPKKKRSWNGFEGAKEPKLTSWQRPKGKVYLMGLKKNVRQNQSIIKGVETSRYKWKEYSLICHV